jgi:protein TonB
VRASEIRDCRDAATGDRLGVLMTAAVLRARAWGTSIAVHAAIVLALASFLGRGHRHTHEDAPPPTPLVWVEPAPGPAAVAAPAADPIAPAVVAPQVVEKPTSQGIVKQAAKPSHRSKAGTARLAPPAKPPAAPRDAEPAAAAPAPVAERSGVATGAPGGVPGGLGGTPLALSAVATPPELVDRVVPEYPPRARALQVEGQVLLEVVLDRQGRPESDIRVLHSVALLDAAAIAAVRQWRFRPARDAEGRPVRVLMEVPVRFLLR